MTGPVDILAEEAVVTAVANELREASIAYHDWTMAHINPLTTWESFEREINTPEYRAIITRYDAAKRQASILLRQREAGY